MPRNSDEYGRDFMTEMVHAFGTNIRTLSNPQTLEAIVRPAYLDPFWKALGWDVANAPP